MSGQFHLIYTPAASNWNSEIEQSHVLCRAYSLFMARVASFASERSEDANDATRDTNKLSARQKSCDYHYYQYTMPNRTSLFHKVKIVENEIMLRATNSIYSPYFAVWPPKRSVLERELGHLAACSDTNVHLVFE